MDPIGILLRAAANWRFRGKGRLTTYWIAHQRPGTIRVKKFGRTGRITCDLGQPYEAMIWLGQEEVDELNVAKRLLHPGDRFVDCGANIGLWTVSAAEWVGTRGEVHAFEPNPNTRHRLSKNVRESGYGNVVVHEIAVGAREGTAFLRCDPRHNVSAVVKIPEEQSVVTRIIALDDVLNGVSVAGCKLDVEGYEMDVLTGASHTLELWSPWLCVEFNTILQGTSELGEWNVWQFLRRLGYQAYSAADLSRNSNAEILSGEWKATGYVNLFFIRM